MDDNIAINIMHSFKKETVNYTIVYLIVLHYSVLYIPNYRWPKPYIQYYSAKTIGKSIEEL